MSSKRAEGRAVVVTGVTRGLGRAMAERLIELGAKVAGCGRDPSAIDVLRQIYGSPHHFQAVDVGDESQVQAWAKNLLDEFGVPDLLVNNAAVINPNRKLWELSGPEFDQVIDINIKGVANVIRHVAPSMISQGRGVIVNLSSYWGRSVAADVAPYCASKWAIEGLTKALAQELPAGMAAVPFNPGVIDTDMLRSCFGSAAANYLSPQTWSKAAVDLLLTLGPEHNGKSVTVLGQ